MFVFGALIEFSVVNVITRESLLIQKAEELRRQRQDEELEVQRNIKFVLLTTVKHAHRN